MNLQGHRLRPAGAKIGGLGFTLIEIMVAMVVLAVGLLGMAAMSILVMRGSRTAQVITDATSACELKIEDLKNQAYADLGTASSPTATNASTLGVTDGGMVKEGDYGKDQGLNGQGLTYAEMYARESAAQGSPCFGKSISDAVCADFLKQAGPYKVVRYFTVCRGDQYADTDSQSPGDEPPAGTDDPLNPEDFDYPAAPDCLVDPGDPSNLRSRWLTCEKGDINVTGSSSSEKKLKVLCTWYSSDGRCHSVHFDTTVINFD